MRIRVSIARERLLIFTLNINNVLLLRLTSTLNFPHSFLRPFCVHQVLLMCVLMVIYFMLHRHSASLFAAAQNNAGPTKPIPINIPKPTEGTPRELAPAFFVTGIALGEDPMTVFVSVPNNAGLSAEAKVVVTTDWNACLVVAAIVVGAIVMVASTVETGIAVAAVLTTASFDGPPPGTVVTTEENMTVSVVVTVDSRIVVAGIVVSEKVVVNVMVI